MNHTFARDIIEGLTSEEKHLSSKYFYDENGSRIFQEIMKMPEYYPTDAEFEILSLQAKQIVDQLQFDQAFNIIELGAGDGFKTFKLLEFLVNAKIDFNYLPIDISQEANAVLKSKLEERLPGLSVLPKTGDYFEELKKISRQERPSLLLFLGGNIGNYLDAEVENLLQLFNKYMNKNDKLLIGFDLRKNPLTIAKAYFDDGGITKRFNLNLLLRINRELDADFKIDDFDFYSHYNPVTAEVRSYIVSLKPQTVQFKTLDKIIEFKQNELIFTELSKKYTIPQIEALATQTNFTATNHFLDCKHYFSDSLWHK